jgi:hypothetical protein
MCRVSDIFVGKSKLFWITTGEVFLEDNYDISPGINSYAIPPNDDYL